MKITEARHLVCSLAICFVASVSAQAQIATLSCQSAQGASFSATVFSFYVDAIQQGGVQSSTGVSVDIAALPALLAAEAGLTTYSTCTLANGTSLTLSHPAFKQVQPYGIGANVPNGTTATSSKAILYTGATMYYDALTLGGVTIPTANRPASAPQESELASVKQKAAARLRAAMAGRAQLPNVAASPSR